ncbi:MAG TPA: crosslink repair DNA glycosylase YcaQ family protein, partial [Actinomycetota bacterium]|nr:crosslink repair DNA glycosylase YcaQ family protein [Actinomycetota bacterium]
MARALRTLDPELARRLIVSRQRLAGPLPAGPAGPEAIMDVATDLASLQLDPIGVVARSHLLVLRSRLGRFDPADLEALLWRDRRLFEYWAHAAAIVCTEDYPVHSLLMRRYPSDRNAHSRRMQAWLAGNQALRRSILRQLRASGPLPTSAVEDRAETAWQSSGWTAGRNVDRMLDVLWTQGRIMVAGRQGQQRVWDLAERCLPAWAPTR